MTEIEIYRREEDIPATYPEMPEGLLGENAAALDASLIWQRIEEYIVYRWTERQVIWTVRGPGEFVPDLAPAEITVTKIWNGSTYIDASLDPSPLGGVLLTGDGPYRFTATVGGGTVPVAVTEAFRRLAEYMAERPERHGSGRTSHTIESLSEDFDRSPKWVALAIQLSGAADLLRSYRRV